MRATSSGVSVGNICALRASSVGERDGLLMRAMLLGFLQQLFQPPAHFLARFAESAELFLLRSGNEGRIVKRPVMLHQPAGGKRTALFGAQRNHGIDVAPRNVAGGAWT